MRLTKAQTCWLAGLFEGEACFGAYTTGKGTRRRLEIHVDSVDRDVLECVQSLVGGYLYPKKTSLKWGNVQPQWSWRLYNAEAERLVRKVRPFMCTRRGQKIDSLLALGLKHP